MQKLKVCMFVYNNCKHDARVLKEARTLTEAGYDVQIIAVLDKQTAPYEERQGFKIIRVKKDPVHYRILRTLRHPSIGVKAFFKLIMLPAEMFVSFCMLLLGKTRGKRKAKETLSMMPFTRRLKNLLAGFFLHTANFVRKKGHILFHAFKIGFKLARKASRITMRVYKKMSRIMVKAYKKTLCTIIRVYVNSLIYVPKKILMLFHRPLCFWDYYRRSYHIVKQNPADIYHAHDLNTLPVAWWAKKKLGGKLVYDSHELYTEVTGLTFLERLLARAVEKSLIKKPNVVITVNQSIAGELVKRYAISKPVIIMNCPATIKLNEYKSHPRKLIPASSKTRVVIYQGGFSPGRGLFNLIESIKFVSSPEVMLVLIGWGKLENELKDSVKADKELQKSVKFLPPVPPGELIYWTKEADVGIIPFQKVSLNNYYGLPNKMFEYLMAGIPVAASDFPELRKIVIGHQLGEVFDPEDPKDIARAIDFILSDPARYQRMKENARRAAQIYNWENESKKLLEIYAELTGEKT